jgi:hypothetical protein
MPERMCVPALRSPRQHGHGTTVGILPPVVFFDVTVVDVACWRLSCWPRALREGAKLRFAGGSTVNAYIILAKYNKIAISKEQVMPYDPENPPCCEATLLIATCRQRADVT